MTINMMCNGNKGVLSIPIYSYIDNKQKIKIEKINISNLNNIDVHFTVSPSSKPENISFNIIENAERDYDTRDKEGYRENYNERYD